MKFLVGALLWLMRLTWGLLDSLIGFFVFLFFLIRYPGKLRIGYIAHCIIVEVPHESDKGGWGLEGGIFIFSSTDDIWNHGYLLFHEWGHCIPQALVFGPLHPFVVFIPSVIRFWWRDHQRVKGKTLPPYDAVWFERTATDWGTYWFNRGVAHSLWK